MEFDGDIRNWVLASDPVWKRTPKRPLNPDDLPLHNPLEPPRQEFDMLPRNDNLDIYTKSAAINASKTVVFLESQSGNKKVSQCSGTVIESTDTYSIILTTASLLKSSTNRTHSGTNKKKCSTSRKFDPDDIKVIVHVSDAKSFDGQVVAYDYHYNIAAIKIQSDTTLPAASLAHLNDSITVDPSQPLDTEEESFQLCPRSTSFDLIPGDLVIALGRSFKKPHSIMAAAGVFCLDRCDYDCKELFMASCIITMFAVGGPLINRYGQVIGVCLHDGFSTTFMPINIVSIWWEHYKKFRQTRQLLLGMELTNLYAAPLDVLERILQKFPNVLKGVIVEEVALHSSPKDAGIQRGDVIIQVGDKRIQGFLELFESMWNNVGESVELVVIRESGDDPLLLSMVVEEATSE